MLLIRTWLANFHTMQHNIAIDIRTCMKNTLLLCFSKPVRILLPSEVTYIICYFMSSFSWNKGSVCIDPLVLVSLLHVPTDPPHNLNKVARVFAAMTIFVDKYHPCTTALMPFTIAV